MDTQTTDTSFEEAMSAPKRPQFLTVLCILSFIWSGLMILLLVIGLAMTGFIFEALENIVNGEANVQLNEIQIQGIEKMLEMGQGMFAAMMGGYLIAMIISLLGVIKMWKLQKQGFYIYTVVNSVGIIAGLLQGSFFGAVISAAFITMYGANLKHMNRK